MNRRLAGKAILSNVYKLQTRFSHAIQLWSKTFTIKKTGGSAFNIWINLIFHCVEFSPVRNTICFNTINVEKNFEQSAKSINPPHIWRKDLNSEWNESVKRNGNYMWMPESMCGYTTSIKTFPFGKPMMTRNYPFFFLLFFHISLTTVSVYVLRIGPQRKPQRL